MIRKLLVALSLAFALRAQNPMTAAFPSAVATDATLGVACNNSVTTLSSGIGASDTSIPVASSASFCYPRYVSVDNEVIYITGIPDGSHLTAGTRGVHGGATTHSSGATVRGVVDQNYENSRSAEIVAIESGLGANFVNVALLSRTTNAFTGGATFGGNLDANGTVRATGQVAPSSGQGVELTYAASTGNLRSYDRTGGAYLPLVLYGSTVQINPGGLTSLTAISGGNVGIGTTSPQWLLHVAGNIGLTSVAKATAGTSNFTLSSSDASNPMQGIITLVTDPTAANRRLSIGAVEQGVAYRNLTLNEGGGNVGIGTTNPQNLLDISSATQPGLGWYSSGGNSGQQRGRLVYDGGQLTTGGGWTFQRLTDAGAFAANLVTIQQSSGYVGIGNNSPNAWLDIGNNTYGNSLTANTQMFVRGAYQSGSADALYNIIHLGANGDANYGSLIANRRDSSGVMHTQIGTRAGGVNSFPVDISASGNVGIGNSSPSYQLQLSTDSAAKPNGGSWTNPSDRRLKTNIRPFTDGLAVVAQMNPKLWELNGKAGLPAGSTGIGFIAQDVAELAPYLVGTYKAKMNPDLTTTLNGDIPGPDVAPATSQVEVPISHMTVLRDGRENLTLGDDTFYSCGVLPAGTMGLERVVCIRGSNAKAHVAGESVTASTGEAPTDIYNLNPSAMPYLLANAINDLTKQTFQPVLAEDVQPACDETQRGQTRFVKDDILGDAVRICGKSSAGVYAWKVMVQF